LRRSFRALKLTGGKVVHSHLLQALAAEKTRLERIQHDRATSMEAMFHDEARLQKLIMETVQAQQAVGACPPQ
jgi:hypothetical protein